jgi:plasmid stabilization system protein ParE
MAYKLIIKPLAERDITETYQWYNEKQAGLGDDFLNELERSLDFIKANPNQYQIRYKEVRMTKVRRFPICLHYTLTEHLIFVHAVLSTSRNPRIWKERN